MNVHEREEAVVARLQRLAAQPDGEPDPAFRAATRTRLVAMAAVRTPEPAPATGARRLLAVRAPDVAPPRWRHRFTAGLAGAAMTVTALAALVAVADGARPGDVLYDLKRGTEQTQLALAGDARGRTLLDFASTRLDELEALAGEAGAAMPGPGGGPGELPVSAAGADPALVLETLATMDEQTTEGAGWLADRAVRTRDADPLDDLSRWAADQSGQLAALEPRLPDEAAAAVGESLTLLTAIGDRTEGLQTSLACAAGPAVSGTDDLGPLPATCSALDQPTPPTSAGTTAPSSGGAPGATSPEAGTTAPPTVPPTTVPGTGAPGVSSGTSDSPAPTIPVPTPGGGLVPPLPLPVPDLPGTPGGGAASSSGSAVVQLPPSGPITLCLPPLATLGRC